MASFSPISFYAKGWTSTGYKKASDCLNFMQNGCQLIKVRSSSRMYHRIFSLSEDFEELRWHPTSKKPDKAKIRIDDLKEVRHGKNTETFRTPDISQEFPDDRAFSIIYSNEYLTLDLIASSADEANIWITGLMYLMSGCHRTPNENDEQQDMRDRWLQTVFDDAAGEPLGQLDEIEVMKLIKKLNNGVGSMRVKQKFKEIISDKSKSDSLRPTVTSSEFVELFKETTTRPEIYFLLVRYASNDYMTADDLLLFLETEQGMTGLSRETCLALIQEYELTDEGKRNGYLGIDGFTRYLISEQCEIMDHNHKSVCQDMTQPLSHYFIAASHNTYLTEDQLKGPSSIEAYARVLKKGCRWVELDCWDGANGEPIIYHGHTLTSKISFKSVIESINQHAFETSEYPLILSIENHCSVDQQTVMVQHMKNILQDKLYTSSPDEDSLYLLSPEELKGKILIKGKKLGQNVMQDEGEVTDEDEGADSGRKHIKKDGHKKQVLIKELSDLVCLCKSVRFQDFQESLKNQKFYEICSLTEGVASKFANMCAEDFVNHNKRLLTRVYPNAHRVDSSNLNPQDMWNCGCQIVAMNYQTPGLMMDLYEGKFKQNGQCGYVLKPSIMREEISYFSANSRDIIPGVSPQILHIKLISGRQFPKPKKATSKGDAIDPYVFMEIFGIPSDCAEDRTKTVPHNGYNPIFDESFEFTVTLPEMALVRFVVLDDDYIGDEFIGQYTIPFECLQPGYRHLTLYSNTGESLAPASLFVHIAVTNKRGGGKAHKRGLSVKKSKRNSHFARIRTVGVKNVDEHFKSAVPILEDANNLRENVQNAMIKFKEACGLASIANLKQCIRLIGSKLDNTYDAVSLHLVVREDLPYFELEGNSSEMLRKRLSAFEVMISECKILMDKAEALVAKLDKLQQTGLDFHDKMNDLLTKEGTKGKKLSKSMESFAWNIRILKGQADTLSRSKKECQDWMKQIIDASSSLGILKDAAVS
ncbi:inactive phospholipase C-like protein 2 isoform X2 [Anneissia japonica]|uniref:inactive phospholipase C-like protein 2 isoform X2 n=1 Tax=Anneissia japonica TaxID=1529436 RepID=UPI001425AD7E|nr:inactive phospholipase C-like protein 2 isoform X2 [Anneissia japonica]